MYPEICPSWDDDTLDLNAVFRIAGNEVGILVEAGEYGSAALKAAEAALARYYLELYADDGPDSVDEVISIADAQLRALPAADAAMARLTPEFVAGHALALGAVTYARCSMDDANEGFWESTFYLSAANLVPMDEEIPADRMDGVDMGDDVCAHVATTARDVKQAVFDCLRVGLSPEGDAIVQSLAPSDYANIAERVMSDCSDRYEFDMFDFELMEDLALERAKANPAFTATLAACLARYE